ncbi:MAG TPA: HNH endonuclease signature motif containing protein [Streptosporangiaceae bacterium]
MPRRAWQTCSRSGCPNLVPGGGRCDDCKAEAEQRRGNFRQRGYAKGWDRKRAAFLRRNPACVLCGLPATVADHWPVSRRELAARGVTDPDAAEHLRALCRSCHSKETAIHQPGGWNDR